MLTTILTSLFLVSMILIQRAIAVRDLYRDVPQTEAEGYDWR